jgi:CheY-like chemotaxis protein
MATQKFLLVDDDPAFNFLSRIAISKKVDNCVIDIALNGQKALDYLEKNDCPDIIFLDINMPVIDGFQFLAAFSKKTTCCDKSKIFMLTSSVRQEDKILAAASNCVSGFLQKPLTDIMVDDILNQLAKRA